MADFQLPTRPLDVELKHHISILCRIPEYKACVKSNYELGQVVSSSTDEARFNLSARVFVWQLHYFLSIHVHDPFSVHECDVMMVDRQFTQATIQDIAESKKPTVRHGWIPRDDEITILKLTIELERLQSDMSVNLDAIKGEGHHVRKVLDETFNDAAMRLGTHGGSKGHMMRGALRNEIQTQAIEAARSFQAVLEALEKDEIAYSGPWGGKSVGWNRLDNR
ncbi:hypothetical protein GGR52DRAFT_568447 [Hypoxylon sp. FL1284]|nr:hypothetical protein GGR52DRAFT_568447 [Hypoxylon sp. FL1284]